MTDKSTEQTVRERLAKLIEWHKDCARYPVDVSGSDRSRAHAKRFHEDAAKCIEAIVDTIKPEALAYIDAADELYSALCDDRGSKLTKRQRDARAAFAEASNAWAKHPRKAIS